MKKLQLNRLTILVVTTITLLAAGCSKDKSVFTEKNSRINAFDNTVKLIDPDYQGFGAVKGYVFPPQAEASVSLTNIADGSNYNVTPDEKGLFVIEKLLAGSYTMTVLPANPSYKGVQLDIIVIADQTTEVTITLSNSEE